MLRHPVIHYPADPEPPDIIYQYLLGPDLMVLPAIRKGALPVRVYLPEDEWFHLWTGAPRRWGWRREKAPIGQPAVFYRSRGAFAPLFASIAEEFPPGKINK